MPTTTRSAEALELSDDSLLAGQIRFQQPRSGYRVNVDSLLLADFARSGRTSRFAVDLGSGVGLVTLLLAHFGLAREFLLIERDARLVPIATRNLLDGNVAGSVLEADVSSLPSSALEQRADLVACNPPFYASTRHRAPRDAARSAARLGDVSPFIRAAARFLAGTRARAVFAYPAPGLTDLFSAAAAVRLVPKRLRMVHAFAERPARLALVELRMARPGGLVVEPPFVEWDGPGLPSARMSELNARRASDRK